MAVFVHGGVLAQLHLRASGGHFAGRNINCSINKILVDGLNWAVVQWADLSHLDGVSYSASAFGGDNLSA